VDITVYSRLRVYGLTVVFLEQGKKVTETDKLRRNYTRTTQFKLDVVSILPTDFAYLGLGTDWALIFRLNRLLRIGRLVQVNRIEHYSIIILKRTLCCYYSPSL